MKPIIRVAVNITAKSCKLVQKILCEGVYLIMSKTKNKKKLSTILTSFLLILVVGVVYAAAGDSLVFNGSVSLSIIDGEADMKIVLVNGGYFENGNGSTAEMAIDSANPQRATISVNLADAEDDITLLIQAENTGTVDTVISAVNIVDCDALIALSGDIFSDMVGEEFAPGDSTGLFDLTVGWNGDATNYNENQTYVFEIEIEYEKA